MTDAGDDSAGPPALLRAEAVTKSFPGVKALAGVDFDVRAGEVHALMGENGAGKSTLIKVLSGVHRPDAGRVELDGRPVRPDSPASAEASGISTVFQELTLVPRLSIAENIVLGRQPGRCGFVSWRASYRRAAAAAARVGLDVDLRTEVGSCSTAVRQMVAIARAVDLDAKLLVLDEPTSSLDEGESQALFDVMRRLKESGLGLVFVTHFLDQVYAVTDRITVLRNGKKVGTYRTAELPRVELIGKMLGKDDREVEDLDEPSLGRVGVKGTPGDAVLRASGLGRDGAMNPFDLEVRSGEVVGLAGLLGSGRTEVLRLCFGLDRPTAGTLAVGGTTLAPPTPRRAIACGAAFCPEDRKGEGLLLDLSVRENIALAIQASRGVRASLSIDAQRELAGRFVSALRIKCPSVEARVGDLSGGNQQKVLLARWLAMEPAVLLLDEPTRGIDIGAKADVAGLVAELADAGMAVLFVSSELDEVVQSCDRVAVLRDRVKLGELTGPDLREDRIVRMIAGRHGD
ncbi:MAG: sugar ABC transporter ATP-binding protein [Planctomycetota bacterium]